MLFSVLFSGVLASTSAMAADNSSTALTPAQVGQVKTVVHDYLVSNPQVLVEASMALQKQEVQQVEQKAKQAIIANANQLFADPASPVMGNPQGGVTVVEFFDYQCPHCKDMGPVMDKIVAANKDVRIVLKELPIFGGGSKDAAAAALAAQKQSADKYVQFHEALLAAPNPINKDKVMSIAKSLGLNTDQLSKDMESADVKKQLDDNFNLAQALALMGTPTFVINTWKVGQANNSAENAIFVPGVVDAKKLQDLIAQASSKQ